MQRELWSAPGGEGLGTALSGHPQAVWPHEDGECGEKTWRRRLFFISPLTSGAGTLPSGAPSGLGLGTAMKEQETAVCSAGGQPWLGRRRRRRSNGSERVPGPLASPVVPVGESPLWSETDWSAVALGADLAASRLGWKRPWPSLVGWG